MPNSFDQHVIDRFRATGGRVGGPFEGAALLLLTTRSARAVAEDPGWGSYQEQTTRTLPVVVLERR